MESLGSRDRDDPLLSLGGHEPHSGQLPFFNGLLRTLQSTTFQFSA